MDFSAAKEYIVTRLVKELPEDLYYHGAHHTFSVVKSAQYYGKQENITNDQMLILLTATYYHDAGFLLKYSDNEDFAIDIVRDVLPDFHFPIEIIEEIVGIINVTKQGAKPQTILEKIMCDADHDYFGRNDYFKIAAELRKELEVYETSMTDKEWLERQVYYLTKKHQYFTKTALEQREPKKQENIIELKERLVNL